MQLWNILMIHFAFQEIFAISFLQIRFLLVRFLLTIDTYICISLLDWIVLCTYIPKYLAYGFLTECSVVSCQYISTKIWTNILTDTVFSLLSLICCKSFGLNKNWQTDLDFWINHGFKKKVVTVSNMSWFMICIAIY